MENFPFLNEAVSQVIVRLRKKAGYSQQKLAEISSITRVYLLQLEQGKFRPTLNSIFFLARGLDIPPEEFVAMIEKERRRLEKGAKQSDDFSEMPEKHRQEMAARLK